MSQIPLQAVVKRQLPEFVREDYPTFVAFVEAYYEFLQTNNVNLKDLRDIDTTLDSFLQYFKKEIAHTLPSNVITDEKFLLQHIKDQYLSKGSEASYKLLFRILFGKNVELTYPGRQMLIPSDGRWNQEIAIFAQVDFGKADSIVGKLVDIQTANRVIRVLIDRKEELTGEIDRVVKIGNSYDISATAAAGSTSLTVVNNSGIQIGQLVTGIGISVGSKVVSINGNVINITESTVSEVNGTLTFSNELYEFYLDKKFFGIVSAGDKIRYKDEFQATILPATTTLTVGQAGKNFRVGQVFELQSGSGTGALMKVTAINSDGGIKYAEFIKFGIGYTADFAVSILASNSVTSYNSSVASTSASLVKVNTYSSSAAGTISATSTSTTITGSGTNFGGVGGPAVGDEIWTTDSTPLLVGVIKSISGTTSLTTAALPSQYENGYTGTYTGSYTFRNSRSVGSLYTYDNGLDPDPVQAVTDKQSIYDRTLGFNEQGYVNLGDYITYEYVDGAYAGSIIREFSLNYRNAQTDSSEPAIISIKLGALQKYPGYFTANNGFLDDSICIQDSKYYQAFSYVLRIDERLSSYKSAVKTMLHPAGMALFGEFNITNNYDLSVALESLVKSLGIGLEDLQTVLDSGHIFSFSKSLSDNIGTPSDAYRFSMSKQLATSLSTPQDSRVQTFGKTINSANGFTNEYVTTIDDGSVRNFGKALSTTYSGMLDTTYTFSVSKALTSTPVSVVDTNAIRLNISKSLADTSIGTFTEAGKVWMNSYQGQDYYSQEYSVGLEETFT